MRRPLPCVIASCLGSIKCVWALSQMMPLYTRTGAALWSLFAGLLIDAVFADAPRVGAAFDRYHSNWIGGRT